MSPLPQPLVDLLASSTARSKLAPYLRPADGVFARDDTGALRGMR